MAIVWTKYWGPSDDGTVLKGIDIRNIQDDINTTGLADADAIQGVPVDSPTPADDGKALIYNDSTPAFEYGSLSGLPAGIYLPYGGTAAPSGWLLCYGQAVSRTTYANLFTAISTGYGVGDGATTFNVPDMRGRLPLGKDDMGGASANRVTNAAADTIGGGLGVEEHTLTGAESGESGHGHLFRWNTASSGGSDYLGSEDGAQSTYDQTVGESVVDVASSSASSAHTNLQPTQTGNYIIKI